MSCLTIPQQETAVLKSKLVTESLSYINETGLVNLDRPPQSDNLPKLIEIHCKVCQRVPQNKVLAMLTISQIKINNKIKYKI